MSASNNANESLVVTTNLGDYYVIPREALEQFYASAEARKQIDEAAGAMVPGSFARLKAKEASVVSSFASVSRTTSLSWFQNIQPACTEGLTSSGATNEQDSLGLAKEYALV
jgi:hypothetical protein